MNTSELKAIGLTPSRIDLMVRHVRHAQSYSFPLDRPLVHIPSVSVHDLKAHGWIYRAPWHTPEEITRLSAERDEAVAAAQPFIGTDEWKKALMHLQDASEKDVSIKRECWRLTQKAIDFTLERLKESK